MSKLTDLQRLEFLKLLQSNYNSILASSELQANKLLEVVFEDSYNFSNPKDVGVMLSRFDSVIDAELSPALYDKVTTAMQNLTTLGVGHVVRSTLSIMGDSAYDFLNLSDRLAIDYTTRVGPDGLRLSNRIWGQDSKQAITEEVYNAIRNGDDKFTLAKNLEKVVAEGTPKHAIKRIANTELVYSYSHSKADTILAEKEYLPNAEAYITVSLSPAHKIYDICDAMQGTYLAERAPLPAFHPGCQCRTDTFLKVKGTGPRTTTIDSQVRKFKDDPQALSVKSIETHNKTVEIPKT